MRTATGELLEFEGHDGDTVRGLWFPPAGGPASGTPAPGIVLVHEVFGTDHFVCDVAARFAAEGYAVLAPDLYSREGLPGPRATDADPAPGWTPEQVRAAVGRMPDRRALADLDGAARALGERPDVAADRLAVVGFCMGGNYAYLLGCISDRVAAVVDFYGRIVYPQLSREKPSQPLEMVLNLGCPLLGLFGDEDASIPVADVELMRAALTQAAKTFELHVYEGAGHGFFNHDRGGWREEAAADAWERTLAFLREWLA